jgi:hydroxymethylglutaryl-CoA lyase
VDVPYPKSVRVVEVGPRDGLQNEKSALSVDARVALIEALADAGLKSIEAGSFVSPRWVPQMSGTAEVLSKLRSRADVCYPVLVPNLKGLNEAVASEVHEVAVFVSASETFSQKNVNCSRAEGLVRAREVTSRALASGLRVRGYISCVLGCPYEEKIAPDQVSAIVHDLHEIGCYEISLGDTIGTGTPVKTAALLQAVTARVPVSAIAVHFHDTYGQALANILIALQSGVSVIDSAVAGLGGCPYAPGAAGNVGTEDVLYMLNGMQIETGVDLDRVAAAGDMICKQLGRQPASKAALALRTSAFPDRELSSPS